ncbi:MAG: preprotein translocase subunit SecF [Actinobacteria bacterium BACL15 MAG-120619-bin91]|uniref:Protein-export membrane protein SecF n=1 Tax=Actinobacteria bacterium BACL15 MAG-120619-bin91 TaxID=1655562 RepID=A0A0R2PNR4_9ACTN|nr:MAG: preprotein translocase subunit SecF [Actinobacteria bacterium BACL15 MAG-120619-bin91]
MSKFSGLGGRLYRGETSVNFIGRRRRWYALSGFFVLLSIGALAVQGLQLGIEFKGGSSFTVNTSNPSISLARDAVEEAGVTSDPIVQLVGTDKVRVQTQALDPALNNAVQDALAAKFSVSAADIDTQIIGPSWGKEITRKALYGLFGFLFVVMIYLTMALEPKMAFSAIVAVVHDVFITVGIYALVGFDVTPATIIGFLTILGYSLYDTVVVFDRVRDNTRAISAASTKTYSQAVNLAVNQTIVRSANTSIVAILPVAAILFVGAGLLGAGTLKDLSLALFIGLIVGTYSSIFIAPSVLAQLREKEPAMQALAKRVAARTSTPASGSSAVVSSVAVANGRGPRNQPKRKGRK